MRTTRLRTTVAVIAAISTAALAAGCSKPNATAAGSSSSPAPATTLRLGYFANLTHATAIVGVEKHFFAQSLGSTSLETQVFNAGPSAVEALKAGSLDAAYLGPSPAINGFVKSDGSLLRIVAGATTGGAALIVNDQIQRPADLRGRTIASPQLGGTQDVALRWYLKGLGFTVSKFGKGATTIVSQANSTSLTTFKSGDIDGAWVPEPWASRLVIEGKGHVLVDEASLWPGGKFLTTNLVVTQKFLTAHPQTVKALIQGALTATDWITAHPADAKTTLNAALKNLTKKALTEAVIDRAFANLQVTMDPVAASLQVSLDHGVAVGLLKPADISQIYDLTLLNEVLAAARRPTFQAPGFAVRP